MSRPLRLIAPSPRKYTNRFLTGGNGGSRGAKLRFLCFLCCFLFKRIRLKLAQGEKSFRHHVVQHHGTDADA